MATYGIKDSANLIFKNLRTNDIDLFMDYANVTTNEWTSERVYATKKGTNAIAWDNSREGTFTVETETFDWAYLAMIVGSDIEEGETDIMKRDVVTIDSGRAFEIEGDVDPESVTVIKVASDGVTHDGAPIYSTTGDRELLPAIARNVVAAANAESIILTWDASPGAEAYEVYRDGEEVGEVTENSFTLNGLTPESTYAFTVIAKNEYGVAPVSAEVEAITSEAGVTSRSAFEATEEAIQAAEAGEGELSEAGRNLPSFEFSDGRIRFNEHTQVGDRYAVYYAENVQDAKTIRISADKFPDAYEIWGDAKARRAEDGVDEHIQIHYFNARPQSDFEFTQSATEPTTLSVTFDLFPNTDNHMAEYKKIAANI